MSYYGTYNRQARSGNTVYRQLPWAPRRSTGAGFQYPAVSTPNQALAITATFAFGRTLDLKAIGTIALPASFAFGKTLDLKSLGTIAISESFAFGRTLDLKAIGTITISESFIFGRVLSLTNANSSEALELSTTFAFGQTLTLSAIGTLDLATTFAFGKTLTLQDSNSIALTATFAFGGQASITQVVNMSLPVTFAFGAPLTIKTQYPGLIDRAPAVILQQDFEAVSLYNTGDGNFYTLGLATTTAKQPGSGGISQITNFEFGQSLELGAASSITLNTGMAFAATLNTGSTGTALTEGSTTYFVAPDDGNDSWNGQHATFKGGSDGPWATPNKVESSLPSSATALYWKGGQKPNDKINMPTNYTASLGNEFIFDSYQLDGSTPIAAETASLAEMADWDQGIVEPERHLFPSYAGPSDDHPNTVRRYTFSSQYVAVLNFEDCEHIEIRNQRVRNTEGRGLFIGTSGPDNPTKYANRKTNSKVWNVHIEHTVGTGFLTQFRTQFQAYRVFISDAGRQHFVDNVNVVPIAVQGSETGIIEDCDVMLNWGEGIDILYASHDVFVNRCWLYGNDAVQSFTDTAYDVHWNACVMISAPVSECQHLDSTWTKDPTGGGISDLSGESVLLGNETASLKSSWVQPSDGVHNLTYSNCIGIGNSDGLRITIGADDAGGGARSSPDDARDYENIHCFNCMWIANNSNVERGSLASVTDNYVNNHFKNNIIIDGNEAVTEIQGTSAGLVASNNYWENGPHGGNWDGAGDLNGGSTLTLAKTSGFKNMVFLAQAATAQRKWGDIRNQVVIDTLNLNDIYPQTGSATIGAGTAKSAILVPTTTYGSLAAAQKDINGNPHNDPMDMGPFADSFGGGGGGGGGGGNLTISFVGAIQTNFDTGFTDWLANIPTAATADQWAFALITDASGAGTISSISGWTQIGTTLNAGSGDSINLLLRRKLTSADITAGTWNFASLWTDIWRYGNVTIFVYNNVDPSAPVDSYAEAVSYVDSTSTIDGPNVTPSDNDRMIFQAIACDMGTGPYAAAPTGSPLGTERAEISPTSNRQFFYLQDYLQTTAANVGLEADNDTSDSYARWTVALKPEPE